MDQVDETASSRSNANAVGKADEKTPLTNMYLLAATVKTMQKSNPWISARNATKTFDKALSFRGSLLENPGGSPNIKDDEKEK